MTDLEIVRAILAGRREFFADLVDRYKDLVYTVIRSSIPARDETEDLAQEVFVKAYRALSQFRGDAAFSTWLYRITLNHLRDHRRRFAPQVLPLDAVEATAARPRNADPEEEAIAAERRAFIQLRLAELPEMYRQVLFLYHFHELSYAEIGQRIGLSARSVETRLYRARRLLRTSLEGEKACAAE